MVINQDEDIESLLIEKHKHKSDVFGLWVKLKIPREEDSDLGDQKIGSESKDQMNNCGNGMKRVCRICHKSFSSGKALGGHMRIHVQLANKKDLAFKKKLDVHQTMMFKKQNPPEEKVTDFVKKEHDYNKKMMTTTTITNSHGGSGNVIKKPTCIICGKDFPSMKSLFGHMRCHPERDWRGVHPPSSMAKSASSSSDADHAPKVDDQIGVLVSGEKNREVDLTESLMSWPVTAKRGRKAMTGSSSELSSSEDVQLHDAVNYLMMLAQGDSLESLATRRQDFGETKAANSFCKAKILKVDRVSMSKRRMIDQSSVGTGTHSPVEQYGNELRGSNEAGKAVIIHGESVNNLEDDHGHNYSSDEDQTYRKSRAKLDKREFGSTFKFLTKNKIKKRKKMKLCDLKLSKDASPVDHKMAESTSVTLTNDKYRCNSCDKSFPTHQALGGHCSSHNKLNVIPHNPWGETELDNKRGMHFDKNLSTFMADFEGHKRSYGSGLVEAASSSQTSETSHMCEKMLDFDLNEAPLPEGETGTEYKLACSC